MDEGKSDRRRALLLGAFSLSALVTCLLVALLPGSIPYRITKVLPMLLLCVARFGANNERMAKYVGFGLLASFFGDVVIDSNFVAGLGAFLVAHVFYIVAMGLPGQAPRTWSAMLPAFAFGAGMFWLLVASGRAPEALRIPVTIYSLVISTMFGRAIARAFVEPNDRAARIFLVGAILFVMSDSMIGINRWVVPIPLGRVCIMATYYAGQLLIFFGSQGHHAAHLRSDMATKRQA